MRLMIMFDLPVDTSEQRRNYRRFRKELINDGFLMMQYSIYVRVCVNRKAASALERRVALRAPADGLVQSLMITEVQYQAMNFISGKASDDIRNSAARLIVL
ncbi:CRISPR-associated endonuclease Cas2 [Lacticaseibacillus kribbianus]|uniref:CRISPR-associated endonuclease Cas2 n=1 Tax=Lacticaseibacillus kribbianus TaxID=2926292 RepID=UPI001CD674CE|nr:CRISPR-associated endonuclease Cas2 [Lacticaseibacillus kribbianus]